jgi:hypothetical protein
MADHPRVVFRSTVAGGRVAGLAGGPDVAEVVAVLTGLEAQGEERVAEAAEWLGLHPSEVRAALAYYSEFTDEVDAEIAHRRQTAEELQSQMEREQAILQ